MRAPRYCVALRFVQGMCWLPYLTYAQLVCIIRGGNVFVLLHVDSNRLLIRMLKFTNQII